MSGKLVTSGPFRGLAPRHAGTSLAGFGRLFQSPLEGAPARPILSKNEKEKNTSSNFFSASSFLRPCARVFGVS